MKNQEKQFIYKSSVNGKGIIDGGIVWADNKADALFKAKSETALSGFSHKEIKIVFK